MDEALAPGARDCPSKLGGDDETRSKVPSPAGNVAWEATVVRGDIDAAFARDDVTIVESDFASAARITCRSSRASPSARWEDDRHIIQTSTQVPWTVRNVTGTASAFADGAVRVDGPAGRRRLRLEVRGDDRADRRASRAEVRPHR